MEKTEYEILKEQGNISFSVDDEDRILKHVKYYCKCTGKELETVIKPADKQMLLNQKTILLNRIKEIDLEIADIEALE